MSLLVFIELIGKILTKINELWTGKNTLLTEQTGTNLTVKTMTYDARVVDVQFDPHGNVPGYRDLSIYVKIPLIGKVYNMNLIFKGGESIGGQEGGPERRQVPEFVMSSRELISESVADILRKFFNIEVEPDIKSGEKKEK